MCRATRTTALRQRSGRGREDSRRATASRSTGQLNADTSKRSTAPTAAPRRIDRHHPRQHGALALAAARPRQDPRDPQHPGLHAAGRARTASRSGRRASWSASRNMQTPLLTETMKYITVNPTWNVPPSIIYNEYLPALQQDPTVLERMGLKLVQQPRRLGAHLSAAGRAQCARARPLQLPEQVPGLPARHAGQALVRARQARLQPWLHARAGPAEICRGAAVPGAPDRKLDTPSASSRMYGSAEDDIHFPTTDPGPPDLPDRVRGRRGQAAVPRRHLRPRRAACCRRSRASAAGRRWRRSVRSDSGSSVRRRTSAKAAPTCRRVRAAASSSSCSAARTSQQQVRPRETGRAKSRR